MPGLDFTVLIGTKSGVSGLLDVARQTFKEATEDVHQHVNDINSEPTIPYCLTSKLIDRSTIRHAIRN